jgi:hypothetical protein
LIYGGACLLEVGLGTLSLPLQFGAETGLSHYHGEEEANEGGRE